MDAALIYRNARERHELRTEEVQRALRVALYETTRFEGCKQPRRGRLPDSCGTSDIVHAHRLTARERLEYRHRLLDALIGTLFGDHETPPLLPLLCGI